MTGVLALCGGAAWRPPGARGRQAEEKQAAKQQCSKAASKQQSSKQQSKKSKQAMRGSARASTQLLEPRP